MVRPMLAVLAFPVLVPLLFSCVALTRLAFSPAANPWGDGLQDLVSLVGGGVPASSLRGWPQCTSARIHVPRANPGPCRRCMPWA